MLLREQPSRLKGPRVWCGTGRAQGEEDVVHQTLHDCSAELHGFHSTWQPSEDSLVAGFRGGLSKTASEPAFSDKLRLSL